MITNNKKLKYRQNGFTLIELIVVIAVLAIIAALAIPTFSGLKEKAREAVCLSNRDTLAREIAAEEAQKGASLENTDVEELLQSHNGTLCPAGGEITVDYRGVGRYTIACSIHGEKGGRYNSAERVIRNFGTLDPSKYSYNVNTQLFEEYYKTFGAWETVTLDGVSYYVKPYYNVASETLTVFANTRADADSNWTANLIYNDGTWYQYQSKYGSTQSSVSVANLTWEQLVNFVAQDGATLKEVNPD